MHRPSQSSQSREQSPNIMLGLRNPRENKTPTQRRRQKLTVFRSKSKQNFLTDPQTSDNTLGKSSSSLEIKLSVMQQKLRKLTKQNSELKECIINMKANQFYTVNEEKVKLAISQNERLKQEIISLSRFNEQLMIENQFLQRNNRHLKDELENLTSKQLRKSVDMLKTSRIRESNKRLLLNPSEKNLTDFSPFERSTNQRKTINQVKSNPDLLKTSTKNYQIDPTGFLLKQKKYTIQNQRATKYLGTNNNNKFKSTDEHFLKQFEKYQRQILPQIDVKIAAQPNKENEDKSNDITITPRTRRQQIKDEQRQRSNSKDISLQTILQRKQQMMNNMIRQRQNNSKELKNQKYFNNQNMENNANLNNYKTNFYLNIKDRNIEKQNIKHEIQKQTKFINNQKRKITHQKINKIKENTSRERLYYRHP